MNTSSNPSDKYWSRAIILLDMNAFFASVEQRDNPNLRDKPVGITNGAQGTCLITASYEARAYGVKTGMRLKEALTLCPHLIAMPGRPRRYAEISETIMEALTSITPDIEIFSVDEAFLDITHCQRLWGNPETIGLMVKQKVEEVCGLPCSIGVSGDKTTAKYAAELIKPNGMVIIPPWEAKQHLINVPVNKLCGIGPGITKFLASYNVHTCGDMEKIPISILAKRFGNLGRRMWYMCQGMDPDPVVTTVAAPKSMGHGKIMPPNSRDRTLLLIYLRHMAEKIAARLRRHHLQAQHFFIGWRHYDKGWLGETCQLVRPGQDGQAIYELGCEILKKVWHGEPVYQIQVTALDPQDENLQFELFENNEKNRQALNQAVDKINRKYGEFCIAPAFLLMRSTTPNVIAPAWKPFGTRETIR